MISSSYLVLWLNRCQKPHDLGMKACYVRDGTNVCETYWTAFRVARLGDRVVVRYYRYSPEGWKKLFKRDDNQFKSVVVNGSHPRPPMPRIAAVYSD